MNVAIILSVSEYHTNSRLPGCVLDGRLMKELLDKAGKYEEILFIEQGTCSVEVKKKLSEFIATNQSKKFDEVFFYYTGHGDFRDREFYYILSDFNKASYRQTSLENSELDNLLRQLNPSLTIKVVDACHSGVTYIKDKDIFLKHLDESKKSFSNCYFMFSSMQDQVSYQDNIISHFTKSFIDSILEYPAAEIRYKHIIDHISDDFDSNALQKPFFVTQASFTEIFCSVDQEMKNALRKKLNDSIDNSLDSSGMKMPSLLESIKRDAERYCSEEEVLNVIHKLKQFFLSYQHSSELIELYEISNTFEDDYKSISSCSDSIGKWLENNSNNYFSKTTYRRKQIDKDTSLMAAISMADLYGQRKYETEISGFELTVDVPFRLIQVRAVPKYPNIDLCICKIAFVFSLVSIRFFYFYSNFRLKDWKTYSHSHSSAWETVEIEMKNFDQIGECLQNILDEFSLFILDPLRAEYASTLDSDSD